MDKIEKIQFFRELISCNTKLYNWVYDSKGHIIESDCPNEYLLDMAFTHFNCKDYMLNYAKNDNKNPLLLSSPLGLEWGAVFAKNERDEVLIYVMGPVFSVETPKKTIQNSLARLELSLATQRQLEKELQTISLVSVETLKPYIKMLHFCLHETKIQHFDINYQARDDEITLVSASAETPDRHKTWLIEQGILQMVRDGNLNYESTFELGNSVSTGVRISAGEPLRKVKDSVIIFTSLCTRAAIEGGLTPDEAYAVGDGYIQAIELGESMTELADLSSKMYEDFIHRVNKNKIHPKYTKAIQSCWDYISMNPEEKFSVEMLAARVGYSPYYLSRKFKAEVGLSLQNYVNIVKTEKAKLLLSMTDKDIQAISEMLNYSSRSHFSTAFQKVTGKSPGKYRKNIKGD